VRNWKPVYTTYILILSIIATIFIAKPTSAADSWEYYFPVTVTDNSGAGRTNVPVLIGVAGQNYVDTGFITSSGNATRMREGSTDKDYMLSTTNITTVISNLPTYGSVTHSLYTGFSPVQTTFQIIAGVGGSISIPDADSIEINGNGIIEINGSLDTSASAVGANLTDKEGAIRTYVSDVGEITATVYSSTNETTLYSVSDSGHLFAGSGSYDGAWAHVTGNVTTSGNATLGQTYGAPTYYVYRDGLVFDTSVIPDNDTIFSATLMFYVASDDSDTDFLVTVQNGGAYPHVPIVVGDFDKAHYSGDGGSINTSGISTVAYTSINLNGTGRGWISDTGNTTFMLRSSRDIAGTTPTGKEYIVIYSEEEAGTSKDPKLVITHASVAATITATDVSSGDKVEVIFDSSSNLSIEIDDVVEASISLVGEQLTTGDNSPSNFGSNGWLAQTFVPIIDSVATGAKVRVFRSGAPGTANVSIRATDPATSKPTGADLVAAGGMDANVWTTSSAGSWQEMTFVGGGVPLTSGTQYAVVLRTAASGGRWRGNDAGLNLYTSGNSTESADSGSTWTLLPTRDYMFEVVTDNITIPDTSDNWTFCDSAAMPYADNISITVGGTLQAWYAPTTMLTGNILPDRAGSNNATIIWGSNPSDIIITYGAMTAYARSTSNVSSELGFDLPTAPMPTNWFASGGSLSDLPFYTSFLAVSTSTGMAVQSLYMLALVGLAIALCLWAVMKSRSLLVGLLILCAVLFMGSDMTIIPMWMGYTYMVIALGIMFIYSKLTASY
jgi:hypothetical protein